MAKRPLHEGVDPNWAFRYEQLNTLPGIRALPTLGRWRGTSLYWNLKNSACTDLHFTSHESISLDDWSACPVRVHHGALSVTHRTATPHTVELCLRTSQPGHQV